VLPSGPDTVALGEGDLANGLELLGDNSDPDVRPLDEVGHGTGCAAIVGGAGRAIPPGVASSCTVLPARVLGSAHMRGRPAPFGIGRTSDIDRGVKRSVDLGAKVLNMSFGTPVDPLDPDDLFPHSDVVAYARARGCILVAASGNSGLWQSYTPACLDGVIAVGAVDSEGSPARFSTRNERVALSAPGVRVVSAGLDGYTRLTGTSFAAPFVAGAAGLLASRAQRRAYALDGDDARRVLCASSRPFEGDDAGGMGAGVLDVHAALTMLDREIDDTEGGDHQASSR
jgi:subtilisin family serine protease